VTYQEKIYTREVIFGEGLKVVKNLRERHAMHHTRRLHNLWLTRSKWGGTLLLTTAFQIREMWLLKLIEKRAKYYWGEQWVRTNLPEMFQFWQTACISAYYFRD